MTRSLKGHLLIAGADLLDPNFVQTVTLLIEHNEQGTFGLVLNRPTRMTVGAAWSQVSDAGSRHEGMLHKGGPCEGPMMLLHSDPDHAQLRVIDGVHYTADKDHIAYLMEHPSQSLRCFVGYAGWAGGQLEDELDRESWIVTPATAPLVFEGGEDLWLQLLQRISPSQAAIVRNPELWPRNPADN